MLHAVRSFFYVKIPDASTRTWGLDLIRCIAVLDIVKIHMWQMIFSRYGKSIPDFWPIRGVQLFFVLSGFLIGGIIIRQTETRGWHPRNMFRFMCRRWFRTLPNYYAVLLANILLQYLLHGKAGLEAFSFHFFFFTYNLISTGPAFFMEAWSISIEEWFYFLYALGAAGLYALLSQRHVKPISISIALVMIIVPTLLRFTSYYQSNPSLEGTVAFRIDGIGYGVVAAWFCYYYRDLWHRLRWPLLGIGLLLMIFVHIHDTRMYRIFIMSMLSFGYVLCLPFFNSLRRSPPIIGYFVQMISQLSYSMYLLNLGIAGGIAIWLFPETKVSSTVGMTIFYVIFLWFISLVFYKLVERPFLDLRDKFYP